MNFQKFYGLAPRHVHGSRLSEIPETAYRSPEVTVLDSQNLNHHPSKLNEIFKVMLPIHVASFLIRCRPASGDDFHEETYISKMSSSCWIHDIGAETRSEGFCRVAGQERPVAEVVSLVGNPPFILIAAIRRSGHGGTRPDSRASRCRGMQTHLQCVDRHASCGASSPGPLDVLPGKIQRRGVCSEGGLAMRSQHESGLFVETPIPGLARQPQGPEGKRHRRNRRDFFPEILKRATTRAPGTGPKKGRASRQTRALSGTGAGPGGEGPVGRDR